MKCHFFREPFIPMALQLLLGTGLFFSSVIIFYTGVRTSWTSDKPVARPLPTHRTTQTHNKRINKHPCLEWDSKPTIPGFDRAKTVHALDSAATVIGPEITCTQEQ
jgi:hypothetical protein